MDGTIPVPFELFQESSLQLDPDSRAAIATMSPSLGRPPQYPGHTHKPGNDASEDHRVQFPVLDTLTLERALHRLTAMSPVTDRQPVEVSNLADSGPG